jgi:hypothetical protein
MIKKIVVGVVIGVAQVSRGDGAIINQVPK